MNGHDKPPIDDAGLGFAQTLTKESAELAGLIVRLQAYARHGVSDASAPFRLDSTQACVSAYVEALNRVSQRFWTTTFLSSGFWTTRRPEIIEANERMMARVILNGGSVRRLFLLDQAVDQVAQSFKEQRTLLDRLGKTGEIARLDSEFDSLERSILAMKASGCDLRAVFDRKGSHAILPSIMAWNPGDAELAVYDDFRVDVFEGGRLGRICNLRSFTPAVAGFDRQLPAAENFFTELWEEGDAIDEFLDSLREAVNASRTKIHYRANWLARYEFALDSDDVQLKRVEARRTEDVLRETGRWGSVSAYLDVGTCTGRYLRLLAEGVRPDGVIVGVDDDPECVDFARGNRDRLGAADSRVRVVRADFTAGDIELPGHSFDLITCMMGTLSHFGVDRNDAFEDLLQMALRRMADLLADHGMLILSSWSEQACRLGHFLTIYEEQDRRRLAEWTPGEKELEVRLVKAGFRSVAVSRPDPRLDLWVCCK